MAELTPEREALRMVLNGWRPLAGADGLPESWYRHGDELRPIPPDQRQIVADVLKADGQGPAVPETCPRCGQGPHRHEAGLDGGTVCLEVRAAPTAGGLGRMMSKPQGVLRSAAGQPFTE